MRLAAFAILVVACQPPVPDRDPHVLGYDVSERDGLGTLFGGACHRLRVLGCPEGFPTHLGRTCYEHMLTLADVMDVKAWCIRSAISVQAARDCGDYEALRIRCVMPAVDEDGSRLP